MHPKSCRCQNCNRELNAGKIYHGFGFPLSNVGSDNDFYIDLENHIIFGPKKDSIWPQQGIQMGTNNFS